MKQLKHHEIANIKTTFPIVVICDHCHSPQNVGMTFRICEIMGVQHLYLVGTCPTPPNAKIRKTARHADQLVTYSHQKDGLALVQALKKEGYVLLGLEITDHSKSLHEYKISSQSKIAIIVGAERMGISDNLLEELEACVHIPMFGTISSMNVVMALSIGLYELTKQLSGLSS